MGHWQFKTEQFVEIKTEIPPAGFYLIIITHHQQTFVETFAGLVKLCVT